LGKKEDLTWKCDAIKKKAISKRYAVVSQQPKNIQENTRIKITAGKIFNNNDKTIIRLSFLYCNKM